MLKNLCMVLLNYFIAAFPKDSKKWKLSQVVPAFLSTLQDAGSVRARWERSRADYKPFRLFSGHV